MEGIERITIKRERPSPQPELESLRAVHDIEVEGRIFRRCSASTTTIKVLWSRCSTLEPAISCDALRRTTLRSKTRLSQRRIPLPSGLSTA